MMDEYRNTNNTLFPLEVRGVLLSATSPSLSLPLSPTDANLHFHWKTGEGACTNLFRIVSLTIRYDMITTITYLPTYYKYRITHIAKWRSGDG